MGWLWWWSESTEPHVEVCASPEVWSPGGTTYYDAESQSEVRYFASPKSEPPPAVVTPPATPPVNNEEPAPIVWCGFVETYGRFAGPSLAVGLVVALLWTLLLIFINVAPTWTINGLFHTQDIDDGDLWLLVSPARSRTTATGFVVATLAVFALYYTYLLFLLTWKRKDASVVDDYEEPERTSCCTFICDAIKKCVGELDDEARPYLKISEELPEIIYQTLLLHVFMLRGMGSALVIVFSAVIAANCFVRCYRVFARDTYHERNDSLANALFQFFFAVLFPVLQLLCAAIAFSIDRDGYEIRLDSFEVGAFERLSRFAQPDDHMTTRTVSKILIELQLLSSSALLAVGTCGLHLAFIWRAHDILLGSLLGYKKKRIPSSALMSDDDESCFDVVRAIRALYSFFVKIVMACLCVSTKFIPWFFAAVLFTYGVGILVATNVGIAFSRDACQPFKPQCALNAHEFHGLSTNDYKSCGCIVYVSQPNAMTTSWTQWTSRQNVASELSILARAKRLEVVQIVDRDLPELPDAVAECEGLRELVLVRTSLRSLPTWLVDMEDLQVLQIAGDYNTTLRAFPLEEEFFTRMDKLRILRLEDITQLASLPAFPDGSLASLSSLVMINLPKIRSIPVMNHLNNLHTMVFTQMTSLQRLPQLPEDKLSVLYVEMPTALCCNGYLDGTSDVCSLENGTNATSALSTQCAIDYAEANDTIACLVSDTVATSQTLPTQQWFRDSAFQCAYRRESPLVLNNITKASVAACDGAMYRECSLTWPILPLNVSGGMCLGDARLQIVHCAPKDARYEAMRRAEIRRRADDCHHDFEQWLGC